MKSLTLFEVRRQLLSLECFVWAPLGTGPFRFNLVGTNYFILVLAAADKKSLQLSWHQKITESPGHREVLFEEVLDSVPGHIQEQLLFCLNLFV